jgi:DNA-binding protein YbaB
MFMTSPESGLSWLRPQDGAGLQAMQDLVTKLSELAGRGTAADGLVEVTVDNAGSLSQVIIDPQAMRLGSAELAAHVLTAARAASLDLQHRTQAVLRETYGEQAVNLDPATAGDQLVNELKGMQAGLSRSLDDIKAEVSRIHAAAAKNP